MDCLDEVTNHSLSSESDYFVIYGVVGDDLNLDEAPVFLHRDAAQKQANSFMSMFPGLKFGVAEILKKRK